MHDYAEITSRYAIFDSALFKGLPDSKLSGNDAGPRNLHLLLPENQPKVGTSKPTKAFQEVKVFGYSEVRMASL